MSKDTEAADTRAAAAHARLAKLLGKDEKQEGGSHPAP